MNRLDGSLVTSVAYVLAVMVLAAGCSASDGAAPDLRDKGTQTCVNLDGIEFATRFNSCDRALERGRTLAVSLGVTKEGYPEAAEREVGVDCLFLQSDSPGTTKDRAAIDLARALDREGVCPGDLSNLNYEGP